jgi:hypothetical protein
VVVRIICNLRFFHDGFQRAVADGLDFAPRGSLGAALAFFVEFCAGRVELDATPWTLMPACVQNLPAVPAGYEALPAEVEYIVHLEVGMAREPSGSMHPLAAALAVLPGWPSLLGRDTPHFRDACTELFDVAGTNRANWAATPPRRQALAVAATISQLAPPIKLTIAVPNSIGRVRAQACRRGFC